MGYDATMYLLERGVRLTGTDAWSWDAPFTYTAERYAESRDASIIWEGHKAGRDIGYCHLEKLHNLEAAAGRRLHGVLLPGEDPRRVGGVDPRRRHPGRWSRRFSPVTPEARRRATPTDSADAESVRDARSNGAATHAGGRREARSE